MLPQRQIRGDQDARTIVVYQAYSPAVADPALRANRFVPPFSFNRMTWIKPSFLWLMHRSGWAQKSSQERILAVRIIRQGWEEALSRAVLTTADPEAVAHAAVHVQWDPERSLRGTALNHYSIQVGIGRSLIGRFAEEWVVDLTDITARARKIATLAQTGQSAKAKRLLPPERVYPVPQDIARPLGIDA
ncbi:DUF4291 domain-containing protein [Saccharopolyspora sp. NPDC050389]|uniref:DUF4291 domain-containing protein n=1 Tax=Saccharopolyspora sp. NPDC050389 TaxID=3155516 RepID=UPI0034057745